jgi:hypothetical protein
MPASLHSRPLHGGNAVFPCEAAVVATAVQAPCVWLSISFCSETRKQLSSIKTEVKGIYFFLSVSNKDFFFAFAHIWETLLEFYFQLCFEE